MRLVANHSQEVSLQGTHVADRQLQTSPDNDFTEVLSSDTPTLEKTRSRKDDNGNSGQQDSVHSPNAILMKSNQGQIRTLSAFAYFSFCPSPPRCPLFHYHEIMTQDITLAMEPFVDTAKIFGVVAQPL